MKCRNGEEEKTYFRSSRCFSVGNQWFFSTREGQDIGPFGSIAAAQRALPRYLKIVAKDSGYDAMARKVALNGLWATTQYH